MDCRATPLSSLANGILCVSCAQLKSIFPNSARRFLSSLAIAAFSISALLPSSVSAASETANGPALPRDSRFGVNQAWEDGAAADQAGAGWSRLTFWWSAFQPNGAGDWNTFATDNDSYINAELKRGRELVGVVLNTPKWAGSGGPTSV